MQAYANLGGDSSVTAYEFDDQSITVEFNYQSRYLYTYNSAGQHHIEMMKTLAQSGQGLGSYIVRNVKKAYASKLA